MAVPEQDARLIQILDATVAEALRRSGSWIACRPGCAQCCLGPFEITQLDAARLREGLRQLAAHDPARADAVRHRAAAYASGDDEPCPALDPETETCDLYEFRPVTCRQFGPAVKSANGAIAACELCYVGATDDEIAKCAVELDEQGLALESRLSAELESEGFEDETLVAFALR